MSSLGTSCFLPDKWEQGWCSSSLRSKNLSRCGHLRILWTQASVQILFGVSNSQCRGLGSHSSSSCEPPGGEGGIPPDSGLISFLPPWWPGGLLQLLACFLFPVEGSTPGINNPCNQILTRPSPGPSSSPGPLLNSWNPLSTLDGSHRLAKGGRGRNAQRCPKCSLPGNIYDGES